LLDARCFDTRRAGSVFSMRATLLLAEGIKRSVDSYRIRLVVICVAPHNTMSILVRPVSFDVPIGLSEVDQQHKWCANAATWGESTCMMPGFCITLSRVGHVDVTMRDLKSNRLL
jgi:hypothetical protein